MQTSAKENYSLLSPQNESFTDFFSALTSTVDQLQNQNIVVDLLSYTDLQIDELTKLSPFSAAHLERQKSFIILNANLPIDQVPEELAVVPTLQEAEDYIQMDELQREFGLDDEL